MDPKPWEKPVTIGKGKERRVIATTREAASFLIYEWPEGKESEEHLLARLACIAVLGGNAPAGYAREAFVRALKEAGILVRA